MSLKARVYEKKILVCTNLVISPTKLNFSCTRVRLRPGVRKTLKNKVTPLPPLYVMTRLTYNPGPYKTGRGKLTADDT